MPCCKNCQSEMTLVTQIYCPLTNSLFHRCLHIFVCLSKPCSFQNCGWRVVRTQQLDEASVPQRSQSNCAEDKAWTEELDDWRVDQLDWGGDENEEEEKEEVEVCEEESTQASEERELTDGLSELTVCGQRHPAEEWDSVSQTSCPQDTSTSQPEASSSSVEGSTLHGASSGDEDSAFAGFGDGDSETSEEVEAETMSVDDEGLQRMMGLLAASKGGSGRDQESDSKATQAGQRVAFPMYYLNVFAEKDLKVGVADDHINTLLKDYQQREGLHLSALLSHACGRGKREEQDAETYDRTEVKHGDRQCYKFIKRLQACPRQCIRYQWQGTPLLMTEETLKVDRCERCQASRVFELQLVPPILPLLTHTRQEEAGLEFGTVLVYSCSASCWSDRESHREELVLLQQDPDQHLFRCRVYQPVWPSVCDKEKSRGA